MKSQGALPPADLPLAALARRQHGVVSRGQLLALGLGATGVAERVRTGRLHRIHRGVYAVGPPGSSWPSGWAHNLPPQAVFRPTRASLTSN
jgi:hypothetical protein